MMTGINGVHVRHAVLIALLCIGLTGRSSADPGPAPSPETAKRCMRYSYILYPYQRPGSVRGSGDRQSYYRDCVAKGGNVPEPSPAKS